ncbi:MAG: Arm DNA-binding domain-containing protein, partial [Steroidobacteraceae bacterium]
MPLLVESRGGDFLATTGVPRGRNMAGKLNALTVDRAHRQGVRVLLCDGDGLYLRKQNRDGAAWTLRYRFCGRDRWITLGNHPDMALAEARIEARQARVQVDKQQNP